MPYPYISKFLLYCAIVIFLLLFVLNIIIATKLFSPLLMFSLRGFLLFIFLLVEFAVNCSIGFGFFILIKRFQEQYLFETVKEIFNKYIFKFLFYGIYGISIFFLISNVSSAYMLLFHGSALELGALAVAASLVIFVPINIILLCLIPVVKKWQVQSFKDVGIIKKIFTITCIVLLVGYLLFLTNSLSDFINLAAFFFLIVVFKKCQPQTFKEMSGTKKVIHLIIAISLFIVVVFCTKLLFIYSLNVILSTVRLLPIM